jgi:hypothetical protein
MHLFIVWTARLRIAERLTYSLPLARKTPVSVEYWMPYPLMINCPTCGLTYNYSDSEEMFRQKELLLPPPPEYFNRLALAEFLNMSPAAGS